MDDITMQFIGGISGGDSIQTARRYIKVSLLLELKLSDSINQWTILLSKVSEVMHQDEEQIRR
jgi:hypothetical protein